MSDTWQVEGELFEGCNCNLLCPCHATFRQPPTNGWCDRTEVLQSLDQFNLRASELGRKVRDLPQSNYLLPMYNLLVEAVEREEGAIRALHNSWRPFTVDAFKAADQERVNANRLRRQAGIGLQGLRDRS